MQYSLRWKIAQLAEIRWWQNYLSKRDASEYLSWKKNYWQTFLERIGITPLPEQRVLDIGCGPAGIFIQLTSQQVTAVDPLLSQYASKLDHFDVADYQHVTFCTQALEVYQADTPFPLVFCINAINHVSDLPLAWDRLVESTAVGGTLVVSIDAHNYRFLKHLFRLLPGDILHPHQYDLSEYCAMLSARNCNITRTIRYKKEGIFDYWVLVAKRVQ